MTEKETTSPPTTDRPDKETGLFSIFRSEVVKAVAGGLVIAAGGYIAALIVSPEDIRRWWHGLPDPNDLRGEWSGQVGGRSATLMVEMQEPLNDASGDPAGAYRFTGWLEINLGASHQTIAVEGKADSNLIIEGSIDDQHNLLIALKRVYFERGPDERFLQLTPEAGNTKPAIICPSQEDPAAASDCPAFGTGQAGFFR